MNGTQILAGSKTYLAAAAMAIYALAGVTVLPAPYHMTVDAALRLAFVAAGMAGLRSGLTTEFQKLISAFGVDPRETKTVGDATNTVLEKIRQNLRIAPVVSVLALVLILPATLFGCATSPAQTVAQIEVGYTAAANIGADYCQTPSHDAQICSTLRELNAAIDVKGDDGQRHGALIAARAAAQSGDQGTLQQATIALQAAIAALIAFEGAHGLHGK